MEITLTESLRIFGLDNLENQTELNLKKIYHRLAFVSHPDQGGTNSDFIRLRHAYEKLKTNLGKKYERSSFSDSFEDQRYHKRSSDTEKIAEELVYYKNIYKKFYNVNLKYESAIRHQCRLLRHLHKCLHDLSVKHELEHTSMLRTYQYKTELLQRKYTRKWWENFLPVEKLNLQEYTELKNQALSECEFEIGSLEKKLIHDKMVLYESITQEMMNLWSTWAS